MTDAPRDDLPPDEAGIPPRDARGFGGFSTARYVRIVESWRAQPSWAHKLVGGIILIVLVGLAALLLVSGLVVGAVIVAAAAVVMGVRSAWRALTRRTTPTDTLRRNVRLVRR